MHCCIIIPIYNHQFWITELLQQLQPWGIPCIIIDDGSEPECHKLLTSLVQTYKQWVHLHRLESNQGKGAALKVGFMKVHEFGFSHAVQIDADGQHCASNIPALIQEAKTHPESLICTYSPTPSPYQEPKRMHYRRALAKLSVWLHTHSFSIKDVTNGFRVYPLLSTTKILEEEELGNRMSFDIEMMIHFYKRQMDIRQLPSEVFYPDNGLSHFRHYKDNLEVMGQLTKLLFHPSASKAK